MGLVEGVGRGKRREGFGIFCLVIACPSAYLLASEN